MALVQGITLHPLQLSEASPMHYLVILSRRNGSLSRLRRPKLGSRVDLVPSFSFPGPAQEPNLASTFSSHLWVQFLVLSLGCLFPRWPVEDTCPPTSSRSRLCSDQAPGPWPFLLTCLSTVLTGGPRTMRPASLRAGTLPRGLRHTGIWTVSGRLPIVVYSRSLKAIVVYIQDANSSVSWPASRRALKTSKHENTLPALSPSHPDDLSIFQSVRFSFLSSLLRMTMTQLVLGFLLPALLQTGGLEAGTGRLSLNTVWMLRAEGV